MARRMVLDSARSPTGVEVACALTCPMSALVRSADFRAFAIALAEPSPSGSGAVMWKASFDIERDGFVLGEGAGIMVLERADHARARGAKIYGRLAGIGMSNDAFHITAPEPDGEGSARAIAKALKSADLTRADIGHVNAHATSTPVGDLAESNTILRAIGDHPVVTATKSMTGHMLGAAGAVEGIATLLAIRDGVVPGTRNLNKLDPEIKLDVAADNREVELTAAVNDSFGFGGHNVALVFSKA